jgi:hypothetical protein
MDVYKDKVTKYVDLKAGPYTFTTEKGTFNDRFLHCVDKVTLATDFQTLENQVVITSKNKEINTSVNYRQSICL